jgi:hypothetical protein
MLLDMHMFNFSPPTISAKACALKRGNSFAAHLSNSGYAFEVNLWQFGTKQTDMSGLAAPRRTALTITEYVRVAQTGPNVNSLV